MSLAGKRVLVTSGPTRGYIDAVRYITNASTGRLGALIAVEALRSGAEVTFLYGKGSVTAQSHGLSEAESARLVETEIDSVADLIESLKSAFSKGSYDVVIHSMAVLDYIPDRTLEEKVPSGQSEWMVKLVKTPKVIRMIRETDPSVFLVGFKLEVDKEKDELIRRTCAAMKRYDANLFVANDLSQIKGGEHAAYMVKPDGEVVGEGRRKVEIARQLIDIVDGLVRESTEGG